MYQNNFGNARILFNEEQLMILSSISPLIIIPLKLTLTILNHSLDCFPKKGSFLRVKQNIFLQDMTLVNNERVTYVLGRQRMIQALQIVFPLLKDNMKARIWCHSDLAYGNKKIPSIPAYSNLIIDVQVLNVDKAPINTDQKSNNQFISQIYAEAGDGDEYAKKGNYQMALRCYEMAMNKILSQRFKQTKGYLLDNQKLKHKKTQNQKLNQKQLRSINEVNKRIDFICVKTIQMSLVTEQYVKVIKYSKQCLKEPRLQNNPRILIARAKAFLNLNEVKFAKQCLVLLKQFHRQYIGLVQLQNLIHQFQGKVQNISDIKKSKSVIESEKQSKSKSKLKLKNTSSLQSQSSDKFGSQNMIFEVGKKTTSASMPTIKQNKSETNKI